MNDPAPPKKFSLLNEVSGSLAAMGTILPLVLATGLLAYGRLGPDFVPLAMMTALAGLCLGGLIAALLSSNPMMFSGPKNSTALLITTLITTFYAMNPAMDPHLAFGLAVAAVAVSALFVLLVALLRLGSLVNYIPYPVLAGFMNGLCLLIIIQQLRPLVGLPEGAPLWDVIAKPHTLQIGAAVSGLATIGVIIVLKARRSKLPSPLVGLAAGALVLAALGWLGLDIASVERLETGTLSLPPYAAVFDTLGNNLSKLDWPWWREVISGGLALGMIICLQTGLYAAKVDEITGRRGNPQRTLLANAVGNAVSAVTMSLPVCAMYIPALEASRYGARTRLVPPLTTALVAVTLIFLSPLVNMIPLSAIAGMLIIVGVGMIDEWSIRFLLRLGARLRNKPSRALLDLAVCLAVTVVTLLSSVSTAVLVGVGLAIVLFVVKMSSSVVRDHYTGRVRFSRTVYNFEKIKTLRHHGVMLKIFELKGALFFGTARHLLKEVLANVGEARYCLLDMRLVTEMDTTGAMSLLALRKELTQRGVDLYLGHLPDGQEFLGLLEMGGFLEGMPPDRIFPDTESALAHIEGLILNESLPPEDNPQPPLGLADTDPAKRLNADQIEALAAYWTTHRLEPGEVFMDDKIIRRDLIVVLEGAMSATYLRKTGHKATMAELVPGSVFNVPAWLSGQTSFLTLAATAPVTLLTMSPDQYKALAADHPNMANIMLGNLLQGLSMRFRASRWEIMVMEDV